jgi:hypothetical protein
MNILAKLAKLADPEIRRKNIQALRRHARGRWWDLVHPLSPDPVFVLGCSRSGTTITYETLAASPRFLHFGVEIPEFWNALWGPLNNGWDSEAAGEEQARPEHRDAAMRFFYQRLGQGWVLDKTCINTLRVPYLHALFPNAKFVFIQRDGRDNISSMMDGWRLGRTDGGFGLRQYFGPSPEAVAIENGKFKEWHFFLPPGWRAYNHASLEEVCAFQWLSANRLALQAKASIPANQWIHLRYEDLFDHPVEMFQSAFEGLGIEFDAALREKCAKLQPTSVVRGTPQKEKWKKHNPQAIERILPVIAELQREMGY